jgi:hypothetical protein
MAMKMLDAEEAISEKSKLTRTHQRNKDLEDRMLTFMDKGCKAHL